MQFEVGKVYELTTNHHYFADELIAGDRVRCTAVGPTEATVEVLTEGGDPVIRRYPQVALHAELTDGTWKEVSE